MFYSRADYSHLLQIHSQSKLFLFFSLTDRISCPFVNSVLGEDGGLVASMENADDFLNGQVELPHEPQGLLRIITALISNSLHKASPDAGHLNWGEDSNLLY